MCVCVYFTFLECIRNHVCREWRLFNYEPRDVRFGCELGSSEGKKVTSGINLSQFSSATVSQVRSFDISFMLLMKNFLFLFIKIYNWLIS